MRSAKSPWAREGLEGRGAFFAPWRKEWSDSGTPQSPVFREAKNAPILPEKSLQM
jgi:hypothetical protein